MERNLLAMMDHPNIARIVEAGTTDDGQLYYAMELVNGDDLTTYCDAHQLSINARLRLFLDVCSAVQHAHHKGIIHRDLKPSNILVGDVDGIPLVKVIDFGLAKSESVEHQEWPSREFNDVGSVQSERTRDGTVLGSLWHMSPEQTRRTEDRIDSRTDIYSLGALLYQLLSGLQPLDRTAFADKNTSDVLEAICNEQTMAPSARLAAVSKQQQHTILAHRDTSLSKLVSSLRNDLDWIVLKAVSKNPEDRYSTVSELAADIKRYLEGRCVEARPTTFWYTTVKNFYRHRIASLAATALIGLTIVGLTLASWGYWRVSRAERASAARLVQRQKSNQILANLISDLDISDIEYSEKPFKMLIAERVIAAAEQLEDVDDPISVVELQSQLGKSLYALGYYDDALPILRSAFESTHSMFGFADARTRDVATTLSKTLISTGNLPQSRQLIDRLVHYCESNFGRQHAESLMASYHSAMLMYFERNHTQAEKVLRDTVDSMKRVFGPNDFRTLDAMSKHADNLLILGGTQEAVKLLEDYCQHCQTSLPTGHPKTINGLRGLAEAYGATQKPMRGIQPAKRAVQLSSQVYGDQHFVSYLSLQSLGKVELACGNLENAAELLKRSTTGIESLRGALDPATIYAKQLLANVYQAVGDSKSLISSNAELLALSRNKYPPGHPMLLNSIVESSNALIAIGDFPAAEQLLNSGLQSVDEEQHPRLALQLHKQMANLCFQRREFENAQPHYRFVVDQLERDSDKFSFRGTDAVTDLARSLSAGGSFQEAVELLTRYREELEEQSSYNPKQLLILKAQLGIVFREMGNTEEAIQSMEAVLHSGARLQKSDYLIDELRQAYFDSGQNKKLEQSVRRELVMRQQRTPATVRTGKRLSTIGNQLLKLQRFQLAQEVLAEAKDVFSATSPESWDEWITTFQWQQAVLAISGQSQVNLDDVTNVARRLTLVAANGTPKQKTEFKHHCDQVTQLLIRQNSPYAKRWNKFVSTISFE